MLGPVYLTYRTYRLFARRLEDEKTLMSEALAFVSRGAAEAQRQIRDAVEGLLEARETQRALGEEKARLAVALANMTRLEEMHSQLLEREQAARASAEQANLLKDQFLATVSHELRTPLNAILGWADMLRNGTLDGARRERACQAIYTSAKRQAQLINDLLDVARIMSRKLQLELSPVDLKDVVRGALDLVQPNADAKRIGIAVDEDPSIGLVCGDSGRLQQVAANLLGNAVKFTPNAGSIHVCLRRAGDNVDLIVTDTGPGIPPDFLPSVFEPFRQADGAITRVHGGLGLGLSIVKHLVEAHSGSVSAENNAEGRGATFTVRLPVASVSVGQPEAIAADDSSSSIRLEDATDSLEGVAVLVVDDDDESRLVVQAHLESHHARVLTATSAAAALELVQRHHVDVLLADVAMPGEDGYALIRKLRALNAPRIASIPAAALTAFARNEDRHEALQAGFQLHLAKPVDPRSLVTAVARLGKAGPHAARA
jgi:signal transduction histidine kinase/CheY-like chemotaxis protein